MNRPILPKRIYVFGNSISRKRKLGNVTLELLVALLILLWIYTGLNKALDYEETRFQMGRSPFIQPIAGFTAIAVPAGEMIIAALLVFKRTRMLGLFASLFLMIVFTSYIYAMLHYSYYVPCSCGGVLGALSWDDHLIFNIIYSLIALAAVLLQAKLNSKQKG